MARSFGGGSNRIGYGGTNLGGLANFAFAMRVKTTQATANTLLAARWSGTSRNGWAVLLNSPTSGKPTMTAYDASSQRLIAEGTTTINDGNWHSLVFTGNSNSGQSCFLYVDGALDATGTSGTGWPRSQDLTLSWGSLGFWASYAGEIADVGYWNDTQLSVDDAIAYHRGMSARLLQSNKQVLYAPLVRDHQARRGVIPTTSLSGTTVTDHPRVIGSLV